MKKILCVLCVCCLYLFVGCSAATNQPMLSDSTDIKDVNGLFSEEKGEFYGLEWNADESSVEKELGISLSGCERQESSAAMDYNCSAVVLGYEGELTLSFQDGNGLVRVAFFIPKEKEDYNTVYQALQAAFGEPNQIIETEEGEKGCQWVRKAGVSMTLAEANGGGAAIIVRNEKYFSLA